MKTFRNKSEVLAKNDRQTFQRLEQLWRCKGDFQNLLKKKVGFFFRNKEKNGSFNEKKNLL